MAMPASFAAAIGRDRLRDTIRVIPLNNADAEDVVPILRDVAFAVDNRRGIADPSTATTIAHHDTTNSLVISAAPETLLSLERVIGDLDRRRAQVLVEAIIVEMSDDTARQLGLQFLLLLFGHALGQRLSHLFLRLGRVLCCHLLDRRCHQVRIT